MTHNSPGDLDAANIEILDRLSRAFGTRFQRWSKGAVWTCLDPPYQHTSGDFAAWLDTIRSAPEHEPHVRSFGERDVWVAMQTGDCAPMPVVLAGRVANDPALLAMQLAHLTLKTGALELELAGRNVLLAGYANRFADCIEELSFLQRLQRHLGECDASRSLADVARLVLQPLRELLHLEGLALLVASEGDAAHVRADGIVAAFGSLFASGDQWCQVVDELAKAKAGTIVRNRSAGDVAPAVVAGMPDVRSMALVPLARDNVVFGWLLGVNRQRPVAHCRAPSNSLTGDEVGSMEAKMLEAVAVLLSTHAANARLFRDKETLVVDVIHTLVQVIEAKDPYTCGHSDRVALIARRLAEEIGLTPQQCHDVFLSGLLHDIGKVGVSDDVLLKPDRLTPEEYEQVKRHPECGVRLLEGLRPLANLLPGVLHHHEAIDGSGYPHGLRGCEIPMMARILAVADAFDAMTSDRPYRKGMSGERAESILSEGAGRQWDAYVVTAFFAAREDISQISLHWQDHLRNLLERRRHDNREELVVGATAVGAARGWFPVPLAGVLETV